MSSGACPHPSTRGRPRGHFREPCRGSSPAPPRIRPRRLLHLLCPATRRRPGGSVPRFSVRSSQGHGAGHCPLDGLRRSPARRRNYPPRRRLAPMDSQPHGSQSLSFFYSAQHPSRKCPRLQSFSLTRLAPHLVGAQHCCAPCPHYLRVLPTLECGGSPPLLRSPPRAHPLWPRAPDLRPFLKFSSHFPPELKRPASRCTIRCS